MLHVCMSVSARLHVCMLHFCMSVSACLHVCGILRLSPERWARSGVGSCLRAGARPTRAAEGTAACPRTHLRDRSASFGPVRSERPMPRLTLPSTSSRELGGFSVAAAVPRKISLSACLTRRDTLEILFLPTRPLPVPDYHARPVPSRARRKVVWRSGCLLLVVALARPAWLVEMTLECALFCAVGVAGALLCCAVAVFALSGLFSRLSSLRRCGAPASTIGGAVMPFGTRAPQDPPPW